jgi:hypothetical protein
VPGVINNGGLGTYFSCTSTSTDAQFVTVEAFDSNGIASGSGSLAVGAGKTVLFGTQNSVGLTEDLTMGSGGISAGSARILSTAKSKLLCTAFVADVGNSPITVINSLTIVAKLKQKAAN